ncbi:anti-sigma factor [Sphingomonas sp. AP4-R1]|uniref:anti-sigma factor family protein n=1 Tax=Sphingomonas sp. AP4-R1 TaxID=2735134 RepID=UPI001493494E|nr:anti-sigma factor [Sphingomonas sp. AP4-R1]QJU60058.1 anti-sigma factor [Sphingomonas sp. AP4-R1]
MSGCPDKSLLVHGLADGEIDAAHALAIEAHLRQCGACRAEYEHILALRTALRAEPLSYPVPGALKGSILAMMEEVDFHSEGAPTNVVALRPRNAGFARHVLSWRWASGVATGLAAGLALMIAIPRAPTVQQGNDLVAAHTRSLLADHLIDVATSDKHVVKPWFNGKIDFAPPVPDLVKDGFPLAGGRVDLIESREVAALIYHRRLHVINVFVRPVTSSGSRAAGDETRDGYNILRWTAGDLEFTAISDLNGKELREFEQLFVKAAAG